MFRLSIKSLMTLLFSGLFLMAAACTPTAGSEAADTLTMYVGPEKVECVGVAPQECLQIKFDADEAWQLLYQDIEGFTFEPGSEYELIVNRINVENPPADASSIRYELVEIVNVTAVSQPDVSDEPIPSESLGGSWTLVSYGPADAPNSVVPGQITIEFTPTEFSGNAGCNSYGGSYFMNANLITFEETAVTLMACLDDGVMERESAYLDLLNNADSVTQSEGQLILNAANGQLVFEPLE